MPAVAVGTLTSWLGVVRSQLETALKATYGGAFEVVHAQLLGPFLDRDVGCIWIAGSQLEGLEQQIDVRVRVFRQFVEAEGPYGQDPSTLEQIPDIVSNALIGIQVSAGLWFFSIQEFEIDHESWGCEVGLLARRENPFMP